VALKDLLRVAALLNLSARPISLGKRGASGLWIEQQ